MGQFFAQLHTLEWIYLGLFCSALIYALFILAFGFGHGHADHALEHAGDLHGDSGHDLGHDMDVGHDAGHDLEINPGEAPLGHAPSGERPFDLDFVMRRRRRLSPLNPVVVATFFAGFGGGGLLATQGWGWLPAFSLLVAAPAGLLLGGGMYLFYDFVAAADDIDSTASRLELYRRPATVVTPIPAEGLGEIVYVVRGSRSSAPARSASGRPIPKNTRVTILKMEGPVAVVDIRYID